MASSVLPRFQPGFSDSTYAEALMGVKVPVHWAPPLPPEVGVALTEVEGVLVPGAEVVIGVEVEGREVVLGVELGAAVVGAEPGTH